MNLNFTDVEETIRDGARYMLQKADVNGSSFFWRAWKTAPDIKNKIMLRKEAMPSGELRYFAYRLVPVDKALDFGNFALSYALRDTSKLLSYQPRAVQHLCSAILQSGAAADGSDTGTGKTYVALAVCRELHLAPAVICKKAGIVGWKRACRFFGLSPLFIINWESARTKLPYAPRTKDGFSNKYTYHWQMPRGCLLLFDECHMACNDDTQNYAMWTGSKGVPSISISATFADRPTRLKGLFNILGVITPQDFDKWLTDRGHFLNAYNETESLDALADMKALSKVIYPKHGYRISYDDPDVKAMFPEMVLQTKIISLSAASTAKQNKLYEDCIAKAAEYAALGKQAEVLVAELRFRQETELLKAPAIAELAEDYLLDGNSVCLFVNYRETLAYLGKYFNTKSLIFGSQERYNLKREDVISDFQSNKERIIICMVQAGGASIDLHDLIGGHRRVSIISPTYDPIALKQVLGRTRRAGSKTTPIIQLVYAADTVEEKVAESVNRKLDNISALNSGDLMESDLFKLRRTE
jgi:superfamily II DNA or RNA helicase